MNGVDRHVVREAGAGPAGLEVEGIAEHIANSRANRQLRQVYAAKAYGLAAGCIVLWASLLAVQGGMKATVGVEMWSDQVLIAVTTGVTVSVLAAFLGVIRGLFPGKDERAPAPP